jgi:hypothetical protein
MTLVIWDNVVQRLVQIDQKFLSSLNLPFISLYICRGVRAVLFRLLSVEILHRASANSAIDRNSY